jgi:glycosyltransferase involved in cell wall biosynthesis
LHVGSALARKNRKLLLDMARITGNRWDGCICMAGEAIDQDLMDYAKTIGLNERVVSVERPDHQTLLALYSSCDVFIFPSFSEGFGWPVIEAQACGAPVIASNIEPMQEVSGGAALHADPTKPEDFANAFLSLKDKDVRDGLIQHGYQNALRFNPCTMIDAYLDLHALKRIKP